MVQEVQSNIDPKQLKPISEGSNRVDDSAFSDLMSTPPSIVSRGLLYLILLFTLTIIIWSIFNMIDVVVAVPANVLPEGRLEFVQQPITGTVKQILVKIGDKVKRGEDLIIFQADEINSLLTELKARDQELQLANENHDVVLARETKTIEHKIVTEQNKQSRRVSIHQTDQKKFDEKINRIQLEIKNSKSISALLNQELEVNKRLVNQGAVPTQKILELARFREESIIKLDSLKSSLRETRLNKTIESEQFSLGNEQHKASILDLNHQLDSTQQTARDRLRLAQITYEKSYNSLLLKFNGTNQQVDKIIAKSSDGMSNSVSIKAPVDGIVAQVLLHSSGESIQRGTTVVSLIPDGVTMLMELRVPDKDIGKIRNQQQVKFKFEAFPFAEYGVLKGEILSIDPVKTGGEALAEKSYHAIANLNQEYFKINDIPFFLLPGMAAMAEISTEQKRIIELILSPISKLASAKPASS